MAERRLRAVVVGTGAWAAEAHVPGLLAVPGVDLVAVCDVDRARAEAVARRFGIPGIHVDPVEMLDAVRPDLACVVTPDDQHVAPVAAAMAVGANVICEKPLATTVAEARRLEALAVDAGVLTRVGFTMRFSPAMRRMREMLADGAIGEPQHLQGFQQNGQFLDPATPFHWKMDGKRTGGGAIVEYGIHLIDVVRWLMGEARSVSAVSATLVAERPDGSGGAVPVRVDDSTAWLTSFASGATGVCHAGWATAGRPPGVEVRVFGSRGALRCTLSDDLPGAERLWLAGPDGAFAPVAVPCPPDPDPWWVRFPALLIADFAGGIRRGAVDGPTFADGARAQEALAAIQRSAREGRTVEVG